jgi:mRNA interferase MazF
MTKETVAPITTAIKGLSSEVRVGPENGLDHDCAVALDNVVIVPAHLLGRTVG